MPKRSWYAGGVRFGCTRGADCCQNHGEYDSVYFTRAEEKNLAAHLKLTLRDLRRRYLRMENGYRVARSRAGACIFLDGTRCSIYPVRPVPCRTWPFWPELMVHRAWKSEVVPFCQGVGCGRLHSREEIEAALRLKADHDRELDAE